MWTWLARVLPYTNSDISKRKTTLPLFFIPFAVGFWVIPPQPILAQQREEISSHEVQPTFKIEAQRNLVTVRVVVRDGKGAAVDDLQKQDFRLFDGRNEQTILHFSLEKPALRPAQALSVREPGTGEESRLPGATPGRFIGLFVDDENTKFADMARARDAAEHFLTTYFQPGDRVGVFTSSGTKRLDFTADLGKARQELLAIRPRLAVEDNECGAMPAYVAYMIHDLDDPSARGVAGNLMSECLGTKQISEPVVRMEAMRVEAQAQAASATALRSLESLIRRMSALPGQGSIVILSGGFFTETLRHEVDQIADLALRAKVIINSVDARGLYVSPAFADASHRGGAVNDALGLAEIASMLETSARRDSDGMGTLALNTGGVFFENNNDLEAGLRRAAAVPDAYYVLTFSPQNLKFDGAFHPLKLTLVARRGLNVQARKGYFAPSKPDDPSGQEKEEIQQAVFSQDEVRDFPVDLHTQFFKPDHFNAHVGVLSHVDLHQVQFRKEADRNLDNLAFVVAVFDLDGHFLTGQQKALELRLRDATLEKYLRTGITLQSEFDLKPGTYLVRLVVRDAGTGQITSLNRTLEIPY